MTSESPIKYTIFNTWHFVGLGAFVASVTYWSGGPLWLVLTGGFIWLLAVLEQIFGWLSVFKPPLADHKKLPL